MPATEVIRQRIMAIYEKSARCLVTANNLRDKGKHTRAEVWYERSAQHLMRANELDEKHGVHVL